MYEIRIFNEVLNWQEIAWIYLNDLGAKINYE
jgi:hypothetical protein